MNKKSTINNILNQTDNSKNIGVEINDNILEKAANQVKKGVKR